MARVDGGSTRRTADPGRQDRDVRGQRDTGEQIDLTRYNANGSVDAAFGVAGHAVDSITGSGITEYPKKLLRQSDGKYVGVAEVTGPSAVPAIGLIRFTTGGVLDTTFGTGGRTVYDVAGAFTATGATLQADGSIVVAGDSSTTGGTSDPHQFALARFTAAGLPDVTFGTSEHEAVAIAPIADGSMASAVRVSGSNLVVAGVALSNGNIDRALARFDGTGHLDPTFGNRGRSSRTPASNRTGHRTSRCNPTASSSSPDSPSTVRKIKGCCNSRGTPPTASLIPPSTCRATS